MSFSNSSGGNGRDFHNGAYARMADEIEQVVAATLGPCNDSCNCTNGERTDLDAENARLRAMRDTWAENDAKLRELVRDLITELAPPALTVDEINCGTIYRARIGHFKARARELGMEVDADA